MRPGRRPRSARRGTPRDRRLHVLAAVRGKDRGRFHWPTSSNTAPCRSCQGWIRVTRIGSRRSPPFGPATVAYATGTAGGRALVGPCASGPAPRSWFTIAAVRTPLVRPWSIAVPMYVARFTCSTEVSPASSASAMSATVWSRCRSTNASDRSPSRNHTGAEGGRSSPAAAPTTSSPGPLVREEAPEVVVVSDRAADRPPERQVRCPATGDEQRILRPGMPAPFGFLRSTNRIEPGSGLPQRGARIDRPVVRREQERPIDDEHPEQFEVPSAADESITPGRSFPANAIGRSSAPVARITRPARTCQRRSSSGVRSRATT